MARFIDLSLKEKNCKGNTKRSKDVPFHFKTGQRRRRTGLQCSCAFRTSVPRHWLFLTFFCLIMQLPLISARDLVKLVCNYMHFKETCEQALQNEWEALPKNVSYCRGEFDGYVCWNHGKPGGPVEQPCPEFLDWKNGSKNQGTFRYCHLNGSWFMQPNANGVMKVWHHRENCNPFDFLNMNENLPKDAADLDMLNTLTLVYTTGYVVSLTFLVVALFILVFFKRLHCTRNYIHMNLMVSFIIRYVAVIVKDKILQTLFEGNLFSEGLDIAKMKVYCDEVGGVSGAMISCRLVITLMHYAVVANYFWLLVEGVYLHLLLIHTRPIPDHKLFPIFMGFGWGGPWIPVGVWVVLRFTLENEGCWEISEKLGLFWSIGGPVVASIAINFCIFVNIIRIIVSKLRAKNMTRKDYKYRLARSTLALIPLLGIHYIVFLVVIDGVVGKNSSIMNVKIAFEMVFTSIQGMLVAIFYCFLNGEVKTEISKGWKKWKANHGLPSTTSRKFSVYNSNGTTQGTLLTMYERSTEVSHNLESTQLNPTDKAEIKSIGCNSFTGEEMRTFRQSEQPLLGNGHLKEREDLV